MAMNSNIRLDTQEQLMEDAKDKAKARYDRKLLDDQEEQIRNLLLMTGMQDPRNAVEEPRKAKKEYTHFEDELPAAEDLMALMNDPEAVKALAEQYRNTTNPPMDTSDMSEEASRAMKDYVPGEAGYGRKLYAEQIHRGYQGTDNHDKGNIPSGLPINPSGVVAYDAANDTVLRNIFPVNGVMSDESKQFRSNNQGREGSRPTQKKANGLVVEGSKPAATIVNDKKLDSIKDNFVPPMAKDEPQAVPQDDSNYWMKTLGNPQVDEALKAIADKDPEMLQLPEVQKLVKEREFWRNKGMDLFSFAPLATDPNAATQAAMSLIDKGDKNLMDAADNLEKLRQRQLDATKAVADNLTTQKQIAGGMHNAVLGLEGNLVQAAIPMIQEANNLSFQAEKIHEDGDVIMSKTLDNAKNFFSNIGGFALRGKEKALTGLVKDISQLSNTNVRQAIEAARANIGNVNAPMRAQYIAALNAIDAGLSDYDRAMNESAKLKAQAEQMVSVANGRMSSASNLGGEYKIPEWMNATVAKETFQAPGANDLSTPFSDERSGVQSKNSGNKANSGKAGIEQKTGNEDQQGIEQQTPVEIISSSSSSASPMSSSSSRQAPRSSSSAMPTSSSSAMPFSSSSSASPMSSSSSAAPKSAKWNSAEGFRTWDTGTLAANLKSLANAYNNKGVKGAQVGIYETENFNGSNAGARANLAVEKVIAEIKPSLSNLQALFKANEGKFYEILNKLDPAEAGFLLEAINDTKAGQSIKNLINNRAQGRILRKATVENPFGYNTNKSPLEDQAALIQQLLIESGMV